MLALLIATALTAQSKTAAPIVVPIKFFYGDPVIMVSVDGQPPEEFGLDMMTRHSVVTSSTDAGLQRKISINGQTIGTGALEAPSGNVKGILNALGLNILGNLAIGVDYARNEISFWPGGKVNPSDAKAWVLKDAKWQADSTVWSAPIQWRAGLAPVIPIAINGKQHVMLLRVGQQGTSFAKGQEPANGLAIEYGPGGNQALLAHVGIGQVVLPWVLYFRGVSYDPRKSVNPSIDGTFTTENLYARRVIVDLPGNTLYAEQLTGDEQLSMFLSDWFQMPLDVEGEKLMLKEMPSTQFYAQLAPVYDSEVLAIMGQPSQQIIDAARDWSDAHGTYIKGLFEQVWQGFKIKLKRPDGSVVEATLHPPK